MSKETADKFVGGMVPIQQSVRDGGPRGVPAGGDGKVVDEAQNGNGEGVGQLAGMAISSNVQVLRPAPRRTTGRGEASG